MVFNPNNNSLFQGTSCFVPEAIPDILDIVLQAPSVPFWARGEPKEYPTPCLPSIMRVNHAFTDTALIHNEGTLTAGELAAITQCQQDYLSSQLIDELFARFFQNAQGTIDTQSNDLLYWAALAQHNNVHQKYPTRLLDVTSDILVATYFACQSQPDEDGYVFYGNFAHNNLLNNGDVTIQGSFFDIVKIEDPQYPTDDYVISEDTLCLAPLPFPNRPMTAQRGAFVWSRNPGKGYYDQIRQFIIKIPHELKEDFLSQLDKLGYNEHTLFPPTPPTISSIIRP